MLEGLVFRIAGIETSNHKSYHQHQFHIHGTTLTLSSSNSSSIVVYSNTLVSLLTAVGRGKSGGDKERGELIARVW